MKRLARATLPAVLTLMLMAPMVVAQPPGTIQTIAEVERETEEIRGLKKLQPIDVRFMTVDELEQMLIDDLSEDYTEEEWERDESILKLMGFLKESDDYYDIMLGLYTEQIAGFYDPEEKYLAIISDNEEMSALDEMYLSHELTHALQDQYYHLDQPPYDNPDSTNLDADYAATCLIEGDATLTMTLYQRTFTSEDYAEILEDYGDINSSRFDAAPQYIQDSLLFPYEQGEVFVNRLYSRGEFDAVDAAYKDPPVSTEQIMHPEKYKSRELPVRVECKDIRSDLGEGWELTDTNVLGEFDVEELMLTELQSTDASTAAEGWGGCQYHFYQGENGENLVLIDLAWDDNAEAEEFAGIFSQYAEKRFGVKGDPEWTEGGWAVWDGGKKYRAALSLEGKKTYIVMASSDDATIAAIESLGPGGEMLEDIIESQPDLEGAPGEGIGVNGVLITVFGLLILLVLVGLVVLWTMLSKKNSYQVVQGQVPQPPDWPQGPPQAYGPYRPPPPPVPPQPPPPPELPGLGPPAGDA